LNEFILLVFLNYLGATAGRIFEFVHGDASNTSVPAIITPQNLPAIVGALLESIKDEPHIAEKVCYALSQLAAGFRDSAATSPLSPYFKDIVQALLEAVRHRAPCPLAVPLSQRASSRRGAWSPRRV
jgi:hypothetical protein